MKMQYKLSNGVKKILIITAFILMFSPALVAEAHTGEINSGSSTEVYNVMNKMMSGEDLTPGELEIMYGYMSENHESHHDGDFRGFGMPMMGMMGFGNMMNGYSFGGTMTLYYWLGIALMIVWLAVGILTAVYLFKKLNK